MRRFAYGKLLGSLVLGAVGVLAWVSGTRAAGPAAAGGGDLFAAALTAADVDAAQCVATNGASEAVADPQVVLQVLGLAPRSERFKGWLPPDAGAPGTAKKKGRQPKVEISYRLTFKQPVTMGSVLCDEDEVYYLKADAPYPGDPAEDAHWQAVPPQPRQGGPRVLALPPATSTRALLVVTHRAVDRTALSLCRPLQKRLYNLTPTATVNAESEATHHPDMGPPWTEYAANLTRGGQWANTCEDKDHRFSRPPVSDVAPSWLVLSWDDAQDVVGVAVAGNLKSYRLLQFTGGAGFNPAVAGEDEWRKLATQPVDFAGFGPDAQSVPPSHTRALKLKILATHDGPVARVSLLSVLRDLGTAAVPPPPVAQAAAAPFRITYPLAADGQVTLAIDNADGVRVRNLFARRDRLAGEQQEPWDLRDNNGQMVPPGEYHWKLIAHPPLELRYQITPYPNVRNTDPTHAPWEAGQNGTGGWLADHSTEDAICTFGDKIYLGAPCAEWGLAMLEADLQGAKTWSHHNFTAWTGPQHLATDGKTVFVEATAGTAGEMKDMLWAVDIATKATRDVWMPVSTNTRLRGVTAMAARDNQLYLAVSGHASALANAMGADDVDNDNCEPRYPVKGPKANRYAPDPREDFVRLFRLQGTPSGQGGNSLTDLETAGSTEGRQHVVLAFRRAVPVGSLVFPPPPAGKVKFRVSFLKAGATYPPDANDEKSWTRFPENGVGAWDVVAAPENTVTRALRLSFINGEDDELSTVGGKNDLDVLKGGDGEAAGAAWKGKLAGMKLLRRRFENLSRTAKVRVNSGKVDARGEWDAGRSEALSPDKPGIYVQEWDKAQPIQGLAIKEVDGKTTAIDVFTGPEGAAVNLEGDANWEQVATYSQARRYYYQPDTNNNSRANYLDGYVSLPQEYKTRAIRLRVTEQWTAKAEGREGLYGVHLDRGGLTMDPKRCRVYGVAALHYLGGEPPVDPLLDQRLEIFDVATSKVVKEVPLPGTRDLQFGPTGTLFALTKKQVMKLDPQTGALTPVVTDLQEPRCFAVDAQGGFYVFDGAAERQVVRVFDSTGKYLRSFGTPGGFKIGPWDATRMGNVVAMTVDQSNQVWCVESQFLPKRTTRWTTAGVFKAEHFGRSAYGGGGRLDPKDKSRLWYGPLEFSLDWEKGTTTLKNMTWSNGVVAGFMGAAGAAGDMPIYANNRLYMVTQDNFTNQNCAMVYLYETDHLKPAAAVGLANYFAPLQQPAMRAAFGNVVMNDYQFMWSDRNGDGQVQKDEVTLTPKVIQGLALFDESLGIGGSGYRFEVKEFLPNGAPVYEFKPAPAHGNMTYRLSDGSYYRFGTQDNGHLAAGIAPDGKVKWTYRTEGMGVHAYYSATPWQPEQVVAEFNLIGHATATAGDLGEFFVTSTNSGIWHIFTADGLLAGQLFRDLRDPQRISWAFDNATTGLDVTNCSAGQEHFAGAVTRTTDNRFYGVYSSTNVFEILGLDRFKRQAGSAKVTGDDVRQATEWEKARQQRAAYQRARIVDCALPPQKMKIDGDLGDWDGVPATVLNESNTGTAYLRVAHDDKTLYLACETVNMGPLANSGEDWHQLFKTGGAVDLQVGVDPKADPKRTLPTQGDQRLLMTLVKGQPTVVLFRSVVPGAKPEEKYRFRTDVYKTEFDQVVKLTTVQLAHRKTDNGYILEAAIPLSELGLAFTAETTFRLDWGILRTDDSGNQVLSRQYWSNPATQILADVAFESELAPAAWGYCRWLPGAKSGNGMTLEPTIKKGKDDDLELDEK